MTIARAPALVLGLTMCAYWACVVVMIVKVSRKTRAVRRVVIPQQRRERLMWGVWVPLVVTWMGLPLIAGSVPIGFHEWFALPGLAASGPAIALRCAAAGLAVVCLGLSIWCWRHMGRHWRMAVDPSQPGKLIQDGPFAWARHPIYTLSMTLMVCTLIVVPTPLVLVITLLHIALMQIKARSEEAFLLQQHGAHYADYCARTGRFFPHVRHRAAEWPNETSIAGPQRPAGDVRLSFFQRAMLLWERAHPYNAAHAVRLPGPVDVRALRAAADEVCRASGIGELVVHRWRGTYSYRPLRAIPVTEFPPSTDPEGLLRRVVADAMNTPFPRRSHHPIRWIVFNEPGGTAHYVILIYHHVVSDAHGIELLLGAVLRRYLSAKGPHADRPLTVQAPRCTAWINGALRRRGVLATFRRLLKLDLALGYAHKMPDDRYGGDETEMALRTASAGLLAELSTACRRRGVGRNDVFAAALAAAIAERTPDRHTSRRRKKIAIGFILNGRRWAPGDVSRYFGVCLADTIVLLNDPDCDLDRLIDQVTAQTRPLKTDFESVAALTALRVFFIRHVRRLLFIPNRRRSYRRLFPVCAGLTTMVVDDTRLGTAMPMIDRYVRACPPGPAAPLVLAPTILRDRLELSLVYRTSCLPVERAEDLLDGVLTRLSEWVAAQRSAAHEDARDDAATPNGGSTLAVSERGP